MIFCRNCGLIDEYQIINGRRVCVGCDQVMPKVKGVIDGNTHIHFGKYKGRPYKQVPNDYLKWCYNNLNLHQNLREYIESLNL